MRLCEDQLVSHKMADGTGTIAGLVSGGHDLLDQHRLLEAEDTFYQALEQSASISASSGEHQHLLSALQGLAEVYIKRGRRARLNDFEHHRMHIHALTAKRRAIECCNEALQFQYDKEKLDWFGEQKIRVISQLKTMEDNMVKSLKRIIMKQSESSASESNVFFLNGRDKVNVTWLEKLQDYYLEKCASYYMMRYESRDDISQLDEDVDEEVELEPQIEPQKPINFEKVQAAIQKIVRRIARTGTLKIHRDMTPEQKLNLISPLHGELDIFKTFSKALNGDDISVSSQEEEDACQLSQIVEELEPDAKDTMDIIESSQVSSHTETRNTSPDDGIPDLPDDDDMPRTFKYGQRPSIPFMLTPLPFHDIENDAPYLIGSYYDPHKLSETSIFQPGVYRIWRTDKSGQSPEEDSISYEPYTLQTYEEISPLTKFIGYSFDHEEKMSISEERAKFPISASSMSLSFALALCKMADDLKKEEKFLESSELFKHALGILKDSQGSRENLLEPMGHILQQLGLLKCLQGDFVGGSHLMEESIRLYERCDPEGSGLLIAHAWYELGNAYVGEQWKESSLFEHIMRTVQEALQVEYKHAVMDIPDDMSDSDESSEGEAYSISTQEAIVCFGNSLDLLRRLRPGGERYNKLLVEVLTRVGDCQIMVGNYDTAIEHYEEAVGLFKTIVGSATLPNNAHVLAMLGTANFLLTNHPKAISMYECSNLLQKHLHDIDNTTFSMAFTLTMLGISYRCLGHYHKCVAWCIKAFEVYSNLYKEKILHIDILQRWFVTETLYTLGFSYGTLNFHDKSLYYLKLSRNMLHNVVNSDTKQCVRILKAMGDQYVALEDNDNALQFYNEALEMISSLGMERGTTALQNQLLNCMANVHVSAKQYSTAAEYLEQALDYQKNMESSIQDDMVLILRQLSLTYTMSGDIERAIECCQECIEAYEEMSASQPTPIGEMLARLGTLHHVKACIQEDNEEMLELLDRAETHYREAVSQMPLSPASVQYANYLYQQAQYAEALLVMLELVHCEQKGEVGSLCYSGVEQAVLPENLQPELDDLDQVYLETQVYARFLGLLCYKQLLLLADAWDCLVDLTYSVTPSTTALNHSILGYAMLEMAQYYEAARSFAQASSLEHDNSLPIINCWISVGLGLWAQLVTGLRTFLEFSDKDAIYESMLAAMPLLPSVDLTKQILPASSIRDSGYYDPGLEVRDVAELTYGDGESSGKEEGDEVWQTVEVSETVDTHPAILQELARKSSMENIRDIRDRQGGLFDKGYYSSEYLERQGLEDAEEVQDYSKQWQSEESVITLREIPEEQGYISEEREASNQQHVIEVEEEVVETPAAILAVLQQKKEETQVSLESYIPEYRREADIQINRSGLGYSRPASSYFRSEESHSRRNIEKGDIFSDVIGEIEQMERTGTSSVQSHMEAISYDAPSQEPTADDTTEEWVSFAEVEEVETPMAILQVLRNLQGTQAAVEPQPIIKREPGKTWTETYESRISSPGRVQSSPTQQYDMSNTQQIEYSAEPVEPEEEEWVVEEIEVETPAAILQEIKRRSIDMTGSYQQPGHTSPMQISPEAESFPSREHSYGGVSSSQVGYSSSWSRTRYGQSDSRRHYDEPGASDRHSYTSHRVDNQARDAVQEEEETIWVTEETVTTPTAILEAINNNGAATHSHHSIGNQDTDTEYIRRYGSYRSDPVSNPYHTYTAYSMDTRTDIKNGNHIPASQGSRYEGIGSRLGTGNLAQEEWHSTEETVDTPPEVLQALLLAHRSH